MFKAYLAIFTFILTITPMVGAQDIPPALSLQQKLADPLLHQGIINENNVLTIDLLGRNYAQGNTLNSVWLGLFRRYNSFETAQNRTALESKRGGSQLIFDMDGDKIVDWSKVNVNEQNQVNLSPSSYAMALESTHLADPDSPIVLVLLSNQHTILDYLSNGAQDELVARGATVAVMEYPGYGVSVGVSGKETWVNAVRGASQFLQRLSGRKIHLVGHSVGGPLALEVASLPGMGSFIAGAISYGGFSNVYEMAKDHMTNPLLQLISGPVVWSAVRQHNISGLNLKGVVKNGIRGLILHGEYDGAVTPRHLDIYQEKIDQLNHDLSSNVDIYTHLFAGHYHEEVNNFSVYSAKGFNAVWDFIYDHFGWEPSSVLK